jgi:protein ImuA
MPANGGIVWITKRKTVFPPGLVTFGLQPDRICFLDLSREKDALWAAEEALRCKPVTAVVAEIANIDLTASRRLQLAAEHNGAPAFLMRSNPKSLGATASVTRWRIKPLPSIAPDGLPGIGFTSFDVELLKVRGGRPGQWQLEWRGNAFHDVPLTQSIAAPATVRRVGAA